MRNARRPARAVGLMISGALIGVALLSPAGAHVGGSVTHLWTKHIKPNVTKLVYTKAQTDGRYLRKTGTAANADKLDGRHGSEFALADLAWHHVGASSEPPFNVIDGGSDIRCSWANLDGTHNPAAFSKDGFGMVHLQGLVKAVHGSGGLCQNGSEEDALIFVLPQGYRPLYRTVFATMANAQLMRVNVDPDGTVSIGTEFSIYDADDWVSLDGLSFEPTD